MAKQISITAASSLRGDFYLPGDKSISHRSGMFAALGNGISYVRNYSSARDCQNTLDCLEGLGVKIVRSPDLITVHGVGLQGLQAPQQRLDVGNSGTTIRLLSGILAGQNFTTEITGDDSIQGRPMKRVIDPLTQMGAKIEARDSSYAPLKISGGNLQGIEYATPIASAQVKSCVLLAGLFANGETAVIEKTPTRNHTEIMLQECGVPLTIQTDASGARIGVRGGSDLRALGEYTVAGDLSSAAFFIAAGLIVSNAELRIRHIGVNPSRMGLIQVLRDLGGKIVIENERLAHGEPVADFLIQNSTLKGEMELRGELIANLIDEIPVLAVVATQMEGSLTIREAHELRVKESDRIRSIVDNLRALGAEIEEFDDGMRIHGKQQLTGALVESNHDHRIAMAFAVAGLIASGVTTINNSDAAGVSLPEFYQLLENCRA